jgi:ribosomal protein L11 methyltransferase
MIPPDARLYIYEINRDTSVGADTPNSYVGLWDEDGFTYLFFTGPEDAFVRSIAPRGASWTRHEIDYKDWQVGISPMGFKLGSLSFAPADQKNTHAHTIRLDPSVVFGDGSHPTTIGCLEFLHEIINAYDIRSMLDLGTGTGILALAAVRLGVDHVIAVDKNDLAFHTAKQNVRLNDLTEKIDVRKGEARLFLNRPFDLIAANLPFRVLRDLISLDSAPLHGLWLVSGINRSQADTLEELFKDQGMELLERRSTEIWETFLARGSRFKADPHLQL